MTLNQKLAIFAVILGAIAMLGDPHGGEVVTLDTRELASVVEREVDHVTATELADWIVKGRTDYRLLDIRSEESYGTYHIPTAELAPLSALADHPIERNETLVLYSDGGIHSAQAWLLLRARGYGGTYMLLGGLDAWKDEVLFPVAPTSQDPAEIAAFEQARHVAERFGGKAQMAGSATQPEARPEVVLPTVDPSVAAPLAKRKKKKEGC